MHHDFVVALATAFLAAGLVATYVSWKRGRYGWALFCMFWVGYNARSLFGLL